MNFFKNIKILKSKRSGNCPYCGEELDKIPGAKTKCPHCGRFMYVRTDPKSEAKVVVTKKQAEDIDHEWSVKNGFKSEGDKKDKIYELSWKRGEKTIVNKFLEATSQCGINEKEVYQRRQKSTDINNAIWSLCNQHLLENQKIGNLDNIISLYLFMERMRVAEKKNANYIVKRRMHFQLLRLKKNGMPIVIPVSSYDSCDACKKLDGKEFDIDEAIKNQPFPPEECSCMRCSLNIS